MADAPGYSHAQRTDAVDFMADYPEYGEMRWYSEALGTEQVSFSWRRMSPGTGGRGSYGIVIPARRRSSSSSPGR